MTANIFYEKKFVLFQPFGDVLRLTYETAQKSSGNVEQLKISIMVSNTIFLIGICVVLPIIVVFMNNRTAQNETNKKTEVLLKSIEAGAKIDSEYFKPQLKEKTLKEKLLGKLTAACVVTAIGLAFCIAGGSYFIEFILIGSVVLAIGIALFISYFISKNMLAKEIEAEEESLKSQK